jgi:hypothetical protein
MANNQECGITFDGFIDALDADSSLSDAFATCVEAVMKVNRQFKEEKPSKGVKKK